MNRSDMEAFARDWVAAWNRRDVEAVLVHFSEGVRFISPTAQTVVGRSTIDCKSDLRAYWQQALQPGTPFHFALDHAIWDADRRELVIMFVRSSGGEARRACELLEFDASGLVVRGEALRGAAL